MSPRKLNTLASRLNLRIHKNDRKFYKKYNYRLGFYYIQSIVDATEYFNTLGEMRVAVDLNDMHMRRERNKINIYADNLELMENFIETYPDQDYVDIGYFPADIPPNVKLRKTEPEFPYEVKLGRNKSVKNSPRTCDIDIIDYNKRKITSEIILPHPRIQSRNFVLLPLFEINKDWIHPISKHSIKRLILSLPNRDIRSIKQI